MEAAENECMPRHSKVQLEALGVKTVQVVYVMLLVHFRLAPLVTKVVLQMFLRFWGYLGLV